MRYEVDILKPVLPRDGDIAPIWYQVYRVGRAELCGSRGSSEEAFPVD